MLKQSQHTRNTASAQNAADKAAAASRRIEHLKSIAHEKNKIRRLPKTIREEFEKRLEEGEFSSFADGSRWLQERGFNISGEAVGKYTRKFEKKLEALKIATAQARIVAQALRGEGADLDEAILRLIQGEMFHLLCSLHHTKVEPTKMWTLSRTAKGIVETNIVFEKWRQESRAKLKAGVGAAERKVVEARAKGLSPEAAEEIRKALLEIRV